MFNIIDKSRRQLLSGKLSGLPSSPSGPIFRPPWTSELSIINACTGCGDCTVACPDDLISLDGKGHPIMNFSHSGCDYCSECADSCKHGVFLSNEKRDSNNAWQQQAHINQDCLNYKNIICHSCQDVCEPEAISFSRVIPHTEIPNSEHAPLSILRVPQPVISTDLCDGCGFCLSICPIRAIELTII